MKYFLLKLKEKANINDLKPKENMVCEAEQHLIRLHASDNDPYFFIQKRLSSGWYLLEFSISTSDSIGVKEASIYYDTGNGFSESQVVKTYYQSGHRYNRVIYFSDEINELRFDPSSECGDLCITHFKLRAIKEKAAIKEMLKKINEFDRLDSPRKNLKNNIKYEKFELLNLYNTIFIKNFVADDYKEWMSLVEQPRLSEYYSNFLSDLASDNVILFSVVMPVYKPNLMYLEKAIASVENQLYSHWELCIVDDGSDCETFKQWLIEKSRQDKRIKVKFRTFNGHISAASNDCIDMATGHYLVLLDQDDELSEYALIAAVDCIVKNPNVKLIYSDEDKIDEFENRSEPHFKPKLNMDLLLSINYISHLSIYEIETVRKIGGFRLGIEGSQDYDLCLRFIASLRKPNDEVVHIPEVLYHWRMLEGSTAKASSGKDYTWQAGLKTLENYFAIQKINVKVKKGLLPNTYNVKYPIVESPLVSLIIPTRDCLSLLKNCISSILDKTTYTNYEILIVDNNSQLEETKKYFDYLKKFNNISVISYPHEFNYSAINNYAAKQAKGTILGLINNDVEVIASDWLGEMVSHTLRHDIGCVGAKLLYSDNRVQHAGVVLGIGGVAGHSHKYYDGDHHGYFSRLQVVQNFSAVTAACLLVRKDLYEKVGGLDEKNLPIAFNDVDFCLKIQSLGYRNLWTPYALLFHHESISRGEEDTPAKKTRFMNEALYMLDRWSHILNQDPFYSPNLSLTHEDFSIKIP